MRTVPIRRILVTAALLLGACDSGGGSQLDTIAPTSATATGPLPTLPATSASPTVAAA
ncbi:MAG: hypothetical protein HY826_06300 [Actinobacteria bacterium]|nr:hypothetical protein [Actinomycetota bacterium]